MITFLWAKLLWVLLAVPLLIAAYVRFLSRARRSVRFSTVAVLREAAPGSSRLRRHLPPALLLLAVTALLLCVARPAADISWLADQRTIVLAIDVSTSMAAKDVKPTRIEAAQVAARAFIDAVPRGVKVGIVTFADYAQVVQVPTRNRAYLHQAIDRLQLDYGTALSSGVIASLMCLFPEQGVGVNYDVFGVGMWYDGGRAVAMPPGAMAAPGSPVRRMPAGANDQAAIVLMTDGRATTGLAPQLAAGYAAERGVRVYAVGFGTGKATVELEDGGVADATLDEESLRELARLTRGEYHRAASAAALENIFRQLSPQVAPERVREAEITAVLAMVAAGLLFASAGLSLAWRGPGA